MEINRRIRLLYRERLQAIEQEIGLAGGTVRINPLTDLMNVNDEFTASVVFARCCEIGPERFQWLVRLDASLAPDITVVARLRPDNENILDYYLLPGIDSLAERIRFRRENGLLLDVYRFEDLSFFVELCRRYQIEEVA